MNIFYEPNFDSDSFILSKSESHHCVKVLRMREGEALQITDGKGTLYEGRLEKADLKGCMVKITDAGHVSKERTFNLHIAIAPTKSIDRFEWFLEKATECGIDVITPILCEHSERKIIKSERLEKLLVAAMKQSCRTYLPELNPLISFSEFIKEDHKESRYIAHCAEGKKLHLVNDYSPGNDVIIVIGPEGDFSEKEISLAEASDYKAISMGKYRLRTETAAIAACVQINALNGFL